MEENKAEEISLDLILSKFPPINLREMFPQAFERWDEYDRKINEILKSPYVRRKVDELNARYEIPKNVIDELTTLSSHFQHGHQVIKYKGREYVVDKSYGSIEMIFDKNDGYHNYIKNSSSMCSVSRANTVFEFYDSDYRISLMICDHVAFCPIQTYGKIEHGHLSEFDEIVLDDIIYKLRYECRDERVVDTQHGKFQVFINENVLEEIVHLDK